MNKYLDLYRIVNKTFGFSLRPMATFGLIQTRRLFHYATSGLDELFHSAYKDIPIDRPVFILGNPRSGTTFVHRFLLNTDALAAFELWQMLFPSITARKMLGGVVDRFAPLSPARYHSSEAHETSLRDVETDDVMEFFHFVDGGFLWSYFLAWDDVWGSAKSRAYFELDDRPESEKKKIFEYFEQCWKKNMYIRNKGRLIAKSSICTLRIKTLLQRYPDCKLLYIVRDPLSTIPSGMSLLTGVLEKSHDMFNSTTPEVRARYLDNLYQGSVKMYQAFEDTVVQNLIPEKNLRVVTYPDLMQRLEPTMENLVEFLELEPPESFWDKVKTQAEKQRSHKSGHAYSLDKYGLDEARIRQDLAFVYDRYDLEL